MQHPNLLQHPVDAVTDTEKSLFGFEMDVRSPPFDRVGQNGIHEAHDGMTVAVGLQLEIVLLFACFQFPEDSIEGDLEPIETIDGLFQFGASRKNGLHLCPPFQQ